MEVISDEYFVVNYIGGKLSTYHEYQELEAPYFILNGTMSACQTNFQGKVSIRKTKDTVEEVHANTNLKIYEEESYFTEQNCMMVCRDGTSWVGQFVNL